MQKNSRGYTINIIGGFIFTNKDNLFSKDKDKTEEKDKKKEKEEKKETKPSEKEINKFNKQYNKLKVFKNKKFTIDILF